VGLILAFLAGAACPAMAQNVTARVLIDTPDLDPAHIRDIDEATIVGNIFSQLLRPNPQTLELEPDLAKSYEVSPDGMTYTFHLRDDAVWQKGYGKVTADDVKFTFDRARDPKTQSRYTADIASVDSVEVVDPTTVRFHMKLVDMAFLRKVIAYRPGYIVSKKAVEELGDQFKSTPIGSGPFQFKSRQSGANTVLEANPQFYLGPPDIKQLTFVIAKEDSAALMAQDAGQIDVNVLPSFSSLPLLEASASVQSGAIKSSIEPELVFNFLQFNNCKPPFNDVRLRRAIQYAMNKDDLIQVAFDGKVQRAVSVLPPQTFAYTDKITDYPYDPKKAKELLAEAGFPNGLEVNFLYFHGVKPWEEYVPVLQEQLRQVGIKMNVQGLDRAAVEEKLEGLDYQLYAGVAGRPPDPDIELSQFFSKAGMPALNTACYSDPQVEDLLQQGRAEIDVDKRKAIYEKIQQIISDDSPVAPINYRSSVVAVSSKIQDYHFNSLVKYDMRSVKVVK
jgi:peptide/nickel transport system substrate-binding protein